jgi:hypothetical protein
MTTRSSGRLKDARPVFIVALLVATVGLSIMLGLTQSASATSRPNDTSGPPPPIITIIIEHRHTPTPTATPTLTPAASTTPGATATETARPTATRRPIPRPRCIALFLARSKRLDLSRCDFQLVITPKFKPKYPKGLEFLVGAGRHGKGIRVGDTMAVTLVKGYKDGRFDLIITHPNGTEAKPFAPPVTARPPAGIGCWTLQVQVTQKITKHHKVQIKTVFKNVKPNYLITHSGIYRWVKVACPRHKPK